MSSDAKSSRTLSSAVMPLAVAGAAAGLFLGGVDAAWSIVSGFAATLDGPGLAGLVGVSALLSGGLGGWLGALLGLLAWGLSKARALQPAESGLLSTKNILGACLTAGLVVAALLFRMDAVFPYLSIPPLAVAGVLAPFLFVHRTAAVARWVVWGVLVVAMGALAEVGVYEFSRHGSGSGARLHGLVVLGYWAVATLGVYALIRKKLASTSLTSPTMLAAVLAMALVATVMVPWALATRGWHSLKTVAYLRTAVTYRALSALPHFEPLSRDATAKQLANLASKFECATDTPTQPPVARAAFEGPEPVRGVVVVVVDTFRIDRFGSWRDGTPLTPNLDAFRKTAHTFNAAYASTPKTWHSVGALLTGTAPGLQNAPLESIHERMIVDDLHAAGVHTAAVPTHRYMRHLVADFEQMSLDAYGDNKPEHEPAAEQTTRAGLALLDDIAQRDDDTGKEQRFFTLVHYYGPHAPYELNEHFKFGDDMQARYDAEIANTDHWVGELLAGVDERFGEDVAVLVLSDHGEEFWDHGYRYHSLRLYDESTRVLMMLRAPGVSPGAPLRRLVSTADVAPTLLELLDVPGDVESMEGRSLLDNTDEPPVFLMSARKNSVGLVDGAAKLIVNRPAGILELYDLYADPSEQKNIADRRPEAVHAMYCKLSAMMREKGEPIDAPPFSIPEPIKRAHEIRGATK
ncbi:hypothetical protein FIV42_28610 [Persicimonas caeni]|uniref:Sulfatase N-terminal domain-containing protein n=1 Tax=Persicimonas caeni TaxID=2292766 RepID=A0A4Y6Q1X9_PERCE|nr:sulfatase [Persicimonas caeni]QDG54563.1 hypothetical protein FIV42_28610 [Persicimonas caeni]QED35784.1 sulfatase-like hydrolase/transferase [Persicimonas caeni]